MAFAAARMILKDKRRKSKEDFTPARGRSKVFNFIFSCCLIYVYHLRFIKKISQIFFW